MKKILRIIGALIIVCCCIACISACKKPYVADNTEHYDAVTKTLKLQKSYADKCFFTDGIGSAKVASYTDGDTTLFKLDKEDSALGGTVNIRYYCIDTPESTGGVEKWGKAASLFVKQQLDSATEIVLEATSTPASKDSYGTRYLGYVWYKTADYGEFKCLNLEIVENGYSENRAINTNAYPYYSYFKEANEFAKSIKLRFYSDLDDPLYSSDPVDITIKEFKNNQELYYNEESGTGAKVRFTAYLKSLTVSDPSGTHLFVAEEYDAETGKTYSINVYTGYNSSPASSMKVGHLYQIVGNIQKYSGQYQISGIVYSDFYEMPDNTHVKQSYYYWNFDSQIGYISNYSATLYSDVTVVSAKVEGTVLTIVGNAGKCKSGGYADPTQFTFVKEVEAGYTSQLSEGDKISVEAYKFDKDKDVLTIKNIKSR